MSVTQPRSKYILVIHYVFCLMFVNELVSHDTRDLMLVLITWGKALHLSNKRFIAVYGFCIKICDSKSDEVPKYVYESKAIQ